MKLDLKRDGPVLNVLLGFTRADNRERRTKGLKVYRAVSVRALVDTGATCTVISAPLAKNWELPRVGGTWIHSATDGHVYSSKYRVRLVVPTSPKPLVFEGELLSAALPCQPISCIIGRDLLARGILVYHGVNGVFLFTLEEPGEDANTEQRDPP